jgi:hypothetical protein
VLSFALQMSAQVAGARPTVAGWLLAAVPALGFLVIVKLVLRGRSGVSPQVEILPAPVDQAPDTPEESPQVSASPLVDADIDTPVTPAPLLSVADPAPADAPEPVSESAAESTPTTAAPTGWPAAWPKGA